MKSDYFSSAVFLALSVIAIGGALSLDVGTAAAPGPGMVPLLLALTGAAFALLLGFSALRNRASLKTLPRGNVPQVLAVMVALAAFVTLLPAIGLAASATLLMAALFWVGRIRRLPRLIGLSLLFGVGAELACRAIGIPLPENLLAQLLTGA
jgi:hypothetical protein